MTAALRSVLVMVMVASAPSVGAEPESDAAVSIKILRAKRLVQQLEYEQAREVVLEVLADPRANDTERFSAAMLSGRIHVILERDVTARLHFRTALDIVPDADLPKNDPPKIRAFFEAVKAEHAADRDRPRVNNTGAPDATDTSPNDTQVPTDPDDNPAELNLMLIGGVALAVGALVLGGAALVFALAGHFAVVQNPGMDVALRNVARPLVLAAVPVSLVGGLGVLAGVVVAVFGVVSE